MDATQPPGSLRSILFPARPAPHLPLLQGELPEYWGDVTLEKTRKPGHLPLIRHQKRQHVSLNLLFPLLSWYKVTNEVIHTELNLPEASLLKKACYDLRDKQMDGQGGQQACGVPGAPGQSLAGPRRHEGGRPHPSPRGDPG